MDITNMWNSNDEDIWKERLDEYQKRVKPSNRALEDRMGNLNPNIIKAISPEEFYRFLFDEYFVWKYTDKRRLARTRSYLRKYKEEDRLSDLEVIHRLIFNFRLENITHGLMIAKEIEGLGTSGASGLLALLFPSHFGTVDQFVIKALSTVENLPQIGKVKQINPDGIGIEDAALIIEIMRQKAKTLNTANKTSYWTPRKIDMVLWACRT